VSLADLDPDGLYHLATQQEWAGYQARGVIDPASLGQEGFVHCSWGHQVPGTVAKHFAEVTGLLALHLAPEVVADVGLVEEDSYGSGQAYPHAYGAIPTAAVLGTLPVA
jgi:uncharacterized protein (DUF952 family)